MRLYTFCNFYLSSIQQGIQTAHIVSELSIQENNTDYVDWATNHKTIIVLNGGNAQSLEQLYDRLLKEFSAEFQVAYFREDAQSLNGAITAVGILVPESVYEIDLDQVDQSNQYPDYGYDADESNININLQKLIKEYRFAH